MWDDLFGMVVVALRPLLSVTSTKIYLSLLAADGTAFLLRLIVAFSRWSPPSLQTS